MLQAKYLKIHDYSIRIDNRIYDLYSDNFAKGEQVYACYASDPTEIPQRMYEITVYKDNRYTIDESDNCLY